MILLLQIAAILLASFLGYTRSTEAVLGGDPAAKWSSWLSRPLRPWGKQKDHPTKEHASSTEEEEHNTRELHDKFESNLQVPCGYIIALANYYHTEPGALDGADVFPVDTVLDPLQERSTIAKSIVMKDRYLKLLYEEGGNSQVVPNGSLYLRMGSLEATLMAPELVVVDDSDSDNEQDQFQLRLGRDFLKASKGKIDMDEMELYVTVRDKSNIMIPFLQSRSSPIMTEEGEL